MNWEAFREYLTRWHEERDLLTPHAPWVLAVSGGPDSMLLLHALQDLSRRQQLGWKFHVAHLHHGLRGADADADAEFVESVARETGAKFHLERVSIPDEIAENGGSVEDVSRQRRYEFLERVALQTGSECVAVAHHADDDAETILHRICRGTGIRGLAGMRARRPIQPGSRVNVVRPLLKLSRETVENLCEERQIESRIDATNAGSEYTRNRIRNVILPMLRKHLNPNVGDALLRLGEQARWLERYLDDAAARTLDSLLVADTPGRIVLNTNALLSKQRVIQAEVIRRAVSLLPGGDRDLSFTHVDGVLILAADRGSGKELHLPGVVVQKVYDRLEFRPRDVSEIPAELTTVFVQHPGTTVLPQIDAELITEVCDITPSKIEELRRTPHPYEQWLDLDRIQPPLIVRGRRDGDRFRPLGAPGTKSLSDFFIDEKVDPPLRARTGVLCDQGGVVWVMPLRIDERVKLRSDSRRALRLVLKPAS